jgi:hypothetical protein
MEHDFDAPICVLFAICNDVIEDKMTNTKSLIGLYNAVGVLSVPTQQAKMCIVASITNIRGADVPVKIDIIDPDDTVVFTGGANITSNDPLAVHDVVLQLLGFPLIQFGTYRLELQANGRYLVSRNFFVKKISIPDKR